MVNLNRTEVWTARFQIGTISAQILPIEPQDQHQLIHRAPVNICSWASPMIKVCHRQDAKSQVYGELSSLEEPMNTFIMQPNTDFAFATIILQCAFTFHPFCKENMIRSLHFIDFYRASIKVIALPLTMVWFHQVNIFLHTFGKTKTHVLIG